MELAEEYKEELDRKLHEVQVGDMVRIEYYRNNAYHRLRGLVEKVDKTGAFLLVGETKIPFSRLHMLELHAFDETS